MSLRDFVITSVGCSTLTLGIVITVLLHVIFICVYDNEVLFPFSGFQFLVAEYDYKSYFYYGMSSFRTFVFFFFGGVFLLVLELVVLAVEQILLMSFQITIKPNGIKYYLLGFASTSPIKVDIQKKTRINQFVLAKLFGLKWVDSGKTW